MAYKKKGQITQTKSWDKHLRKIGKRIFWKTERLAERKMIEQNLTESDSNALTEPEMDSFEKLNEFLSRKMEKTVDHEDLNNLCFSLFCTLDILPDNLRSLIISKKVLAKTFTKIAKEKDSEFNGSENDWIESIDKSMSLDKWPDIENAKRLIGMN